MDIGPGSCCVCVCVFDPLPLQVLVLELETRLQKERERLGELRKKHYELAGVAEGWGQDEQGEPQVKSAGAWLL